MGEQQGEVYIYRYFSITVGSMAVSCTAPYYTIVYSDLVIEALDKNLNF